MKHLKKMLALVMAICLVLGLTPSSVLAADTEEKPVAAAIFASDIHEESTGTSGSGTTAMKNIMSAIGSNGVTYDAIGFVGDTYSDKAGTMANMTSAAQGALGQTPDVYYAYGDHDEESDISPDSGLMCTTDEFYIYHISDANMRSSTASQSTIGYADAITNFKTAAATWDKSKVLFIMSHVPLHDRRDDNTYANYWYEAITEVADTMDVVVFWAHNHTSEDDVDRAAYYVAKDGSETMTIYDGDTITPNFTYMNAGYIYAAGQNPSRKGVATTVEIYSDSMIFQDYNSSGKYTDSSYSHNVTVAREFASKVEMESIAVTTLPTKTTYNVGETFDESGLVVTATYSDGTTSAVTDYTLSEVDMSTAGTKTVTVKYEDVSTTFEIKVSDWDLLSLDVDSTTVYTVNDELTFTKIVLTYQLEGDSTIYQKELDESECVISNVDMTTAGTYNVEVKYSDSDETVSATEWIEVYAADTFTDADSDVSVSVSQYVVGTVTVTDTTENADSVVFENLGAENYVVYDITPTNALEAGNYADVSISVPEGWDTSKLAMYYLPEDGSDPVKYDGTYANGFFTFRTSHFSTWSLVELSDTASEDESGSVNDYTITEDGKKTIYKLVSSLTSGKEYLIVSTNTSGTAYALGSSTTGIDVTINAADSTSTVVYIEDIGNALEWTATETSSAWSFASGGSYLGISTSGSGGGTSYSLSFSENDTWTLGSNSTQLSQSLGSGSSKKSYYLYCSSNNVWTVGRSDGNNSGRYVYFYEKTEIATKVTSTDTVSLDAGDDQTIIIDTSEGASNTVTIDPTILFAGEDATDTFEALDGTYTYAVISDRNDILSETSVEDGKFTLNANEGTATVRVYYTWTVDGETYKIWDTVNITTTRPYYTIDLHYADLTEVASDATFDSTATYYVFNETTNIYEAVTITAFEDGVTYYTTPVVQGEVIDEVVALKGIEAGDKYPVWAVVTKHGSAEETDLGELGDALTWTVSDTSIATIDTTTGVLTFTGTNYGTFTVTVAYTGADEKVITDTITISVTESLYIVPGDGTNDFPEYPYEGAVRFDKTATAVGNFSETGIAQVELSMTGVPYSTGTEIDVVLMLDITGSMKDVTNSSYSSSDDEYYTRIYSTVEAAKAFARAIVINEDGSYNKNRIGIYSFNSNGTYTLHTLSAITDIDALDDEIDTFIDDYATGGTPYDDGLALCQSTLAAAKTDGTGNDRQQFCVFMTDGCPTSYKGTSNSFSSADNIQGMFTGTNYDTRDTDYEYEYYSTAMKAAGVTMYTVGLGLNNTNSAWSGSSATQCYNAASILLNDISGPANEASQPDALSTTTLSKKDSYFFSVDDADAASQMGTVFSNIAQKIVEAAKDVVVEDKIGSNYSINFSLPTNVTTDETDGLSEFYIQVVEYQLDTNKERTGDPYVKENITFTADNDGNLSVKSHTVDGTSCGDSCSHVTITDNEVTAIDGTYFDYKKDSTGEYLTWNEAKISTTELALQYFVHLDNSSDAVGEDYEIPAGTYYTNEYATLTYTNYNGNQVQQEFPVPQMTWNGAQVSYVFYLVNDAGQPVNRAGRVVPFAEAVYVTDVYTYSVVWNSLEQSAGLEADYLAENLVPDVYALYDDDAKYFIHVYEDEEEDNLNNHFTIDGDVTDDYNTTTNSWTNANTTYVFNTKADATKYNKVGTYINSDGTSTAVTSYLCKGDGIVTATIEQVTVADATAFAAGTYFVKNDSGNYVQAALYDESATYYAITSASYTAASGETQAKAADMESTSGATVIDGYLYYIDENNKVYTIVQKSNGTEVEAGFDFHNTTVAFAVVWKPELVPDTVVIDYGLDVVIDVATNDALASGVVGVRTDAPSNVTINSGNYTAAKTTAVDVEINDSKIGTATVENLTSVRFSLDKTNGMQFNKPAEFYYESDVNYYDSSNVLRKTSMYTSVTVIPATTIYYEDEYVTLTTSVKGDDGTYETSSGWDISSTKATATQDTDRPGTSKISEAYDADNVYGYDSAYTNQSTFSMGNAAMVNVNANKYATASFEFYGTGFDVISTTSNLTGTIMVDVYAYDATKAAYAASATKSYVVDTYYGYTKNTDGEWIISVNDPNALYQVPVMKISDLTYGKYKVEITAVYAELFDHGQYDSTDTPDSYDFYLDAIRIYDLTGVVSGSITNDVVSDAYKADGEGWPQYIELRNNIIAASNYSVTKNEDGTITVSGKDLSGAIFIDSNDAATSIADYVSYGPNNEMYLDSGQSVAFELDQTYANIIADVQVALKVGNGGSVNYKIYDSKSTTATAAAEKTLSTATDLYYSIKDISDGTIVITNTGSAGILSITNIKVTYTENPYGASTSSEDDGIMTTSLFMDEEGATAAVMSLRSVAVDDEDDTTDEDTSSDDTSDESNTGSSTEPDEGTTGESTEDGSGNVEEDVTPDDSNADIEEDTAVENTIINTITNIFKNIVNTISNMFGKWFR